MKANWTDRSLKSRVTVFTLVVVLAGIWSLTALIARYQREDMVDLLGRSQFSVVSFLAENISHELDDRVEMLEVTAAQLGAAGVQRPEALQDFLQQRPVLVNHFNAGVFITGPDGVAVASLPESRKRVGLSFIDRDFIAASVQDGRATIGKPVAGRLMRAGIIGMAAPIRDKSGKIIGAVAGITNLNDPNFLDDVVRNPYGTTGGFMLLAPRDKLVITATDRALVMTPLPEPLPGTPAARFRRNEEGFDVGVDEFGREGLASSRNIPRTGWQLVSKLPAQEAFAPVEAMQRRMQLMALVVSLLAAALTWWWLRRQFRPLSKAVVALSDMTESPGGLRALPVARQDEIGRLIVGFNRLIEQVDQQQVQLTRERQSLRNVIMGTGAGTWELDLETGQVSLNEHWAEMIGHTVAELQPLGEQAWASNCHPEDYPQVRQALDRYIGGEGEAFEASCRMRHKDGHWIWVHTRAKVTERSPEGRPLRVSGTNVDITREKAVEAERARTAALLQAVLDSASGVAVIATDPDLKVTLFNKGAEALLGYQAAEVVGAKKATELFDPVSMRRRLEEMRAQGRASTADEMLIGLASTDRKIESTFLARNGELVLTSLWVTRLRDAQGQAVGYLGVGYDIRKEKSYETSLIEARDQAEQATRAKSQFVSNMSHEIRTPMNAILGLLQLLQNTQLSHRQLDYVAKAGSAAKSLLGLINDILDISKLDAGRMELELQPFRLDNLMADLSVILSTGVSDKPVEVLFDISPQTPRSLVGDAMRLKQVLINLGGNAIKFTLEGTVVLQIRVLEQSAQASTLRFSVIDTGIGIAPDQQKRIFEGFSQAEASTTRRFGGSGLGLSICQQLVRLMGGTLTLESTPGRGSRFDVIVQLPHAEGLAPHEDPVLQRRRDPMHVLVVDDNPLAREILASTLESWGWTVDTAEGGPQAVALVQDRQRRGLPVHQVFLVDWYMPQMDGWETLERLQALCAGDDVPLSIMVTAHDNDMLKRRADHEQARLDGYLVKPLTASMLYDAVAEARASRAGARSPRAPAALGVALAGMRLLVVEDNPTNQQVAVELLSSQGALVEVASHGLAGVEAVASARAPFDAVLMDIQMPVLDGFAATRRIREELGLRELPIIAMTANALVSDRADCLAAGMDDHVGKPFDLQHLVQVLRQHVGSRAEELDTAGAVARLGGKTDLYHRILRTFLADVEPMPGRLAAAIAAGNRVEAGALLHTLKGLAATVGALRLSELARAGERRLKEAPADSSMEGLPQALAQGVASAEAAVREALGLARAGSPGMTDAPTASIAVTAPVGADATALSPLQPGDRPAADLSEARRVLASMRVQLGRGDAGALEALGPLRAALADAPAGAQALLPALEDALSRFDFARADAQCQALANELSEEAAA